MKASKSTLRNATIVPTGLRELDILLDGGVGLKRITQFSGRYSVGKSTVALMAIANAQRMGLDTLWLDSEQRFPFDYAEQLGVDLDKLQLEDKQMAEDLFNLTEEWVKKHEGVVVLDSIGGLLTRKEAEKQSGEEGFPEAPKLIPGFIRRIVIALAMHNSALILLNHEKIEFGTGAIKVLGGKAVEFHSDKWIRLRQITSKKVMSGEERVGDVIEASVQKGKLKGKKAELQLLAGSGFFVGADMLQDAIDKGVLTKQGQSYVFEGEKIARGMNALREKFKDESFAAKLDEALKTA